MQSIGVMPLPVFLLSNLIPNRFPDEVICNSLSKLVGQIVWPNDAQSAPILQSNANLISFPNKFLADKCIQIETFFFFFFGPVTPRRMYFFAPPRESGLPGIKGYFLISRICFVCLVCHTFPPTSDKVNLSCFAIHLV